MNEAPGNYKRLGQPLDDNNQMPRELERNSKLNGLSNVSDQVTKQTDTTIILDQSLENRREKEKKREQNPNSIETVIEGKGLDELGKEEGAEEDKEGRDVMGSDPFELGPIIDRVMKVSRRKTKEKS